MITPDEFNEKIKYDNAVLPEVYNRQAEPDLRSSGSLKQEAETWES